MNAAGLRLRGRVLGAARSFFDERGYIEVPTPCLVRSGALEEHLHPLHVDGVPLRTSPEFALKRVLGAGLCRVYEIGPCFRDEERGPWHRREFTMLEWYRVGAGLVDLQREVRELVTRCAAAAGVPDPGPWRRETVHALLARTCGIDLHTATAADLAPGESSWDDAFFRRWVQDIEPALEGARFIEAWPASQAALAEIRTDGPVPVASRFEAFIGRVELANAYQELVDPAEQRRRFEVANAARVAAGRPPNPVDTELVEALARVPSVAGIALGLDRLVAALAGWDGIGPGRVEGAS